MLAYFSRAKWGVLLIAAALILTTSLWVISKQNPSVIFANPYLALGQLAGLLGTVLLASTFSLTTRGAFMGGLFGGLDTVYRIHRTVGTYAFVLLLFHPLFLVLPLLQNVRAALPYFMPIGTFAMSLGVLSIYGMAALVGITLYTKLPYHIWLKTHEWLGLPLMLGALHVYLIPSDVSSYAPLRIWMLGLLGGAILAYAYKRFLYRRLGPRYFYIVEQVTVRGDITELALRPRGRRIPFIPGQFVYMSVVSNEVVGREQHPFSIASPPDSETLRLSVKGVGDYTKRLPLLATGDSALVYGPYGSFGDSFIGTTREQVWVAGGIGVTPFLCFLAHDRATHADRNTIFYYCTHSAADAVYHDEIERLANGLPHFRYIPHRSAEQGWLTAEAVVRAVPDLRERRIFLCGPKPMMDGLTKAFRSFGIRPRNIVFEDFSYFS